MLHYTLTHLKIQEKGERKLDNPYLRTLEPAWKNLDYVSINEEKLQVLIVRMRELKEQGGLKAPTWDNPYSHPPASCRPSLAIDYVCWVNAVNFAFTNFEPPYTKFTIEYPKGTFQVGSFALGASFMRAYDILPVFDAKFMSRVSLKDVERIFQPSDSLHKIPIIRERWRIFREVGKILLDKYNGSWMNLFIQSGFQAFAGGKGIVEQLVDNFPSFQDTRQYKGRLLKFHKRAQLLAMMYHSRAASSGNIPKLWDIQDIGPIADYELPRALRFLGILEYAPAMEEAIQRHQIQRVYNDCRWETENRLAMSYVMKRICDEVGVNMDRADFYVWRLGRACPNPHMLVLTTDY